MDEGGNLRVVFWWSLGVPHNNVLFEQAKSGIK
jgi:hypothetical protein